MGFVRADPNMDTQGFIIPICSKPETNSPMILKVSQELLDFISVHVFAITYVFNSCRKKRAVWLDLFLTISSGVPVQHMVPPFAPPSGPISMI